MELDKRLAFLESHCARGWHVFPCNGKLPATRRGVYSGTDDIVHWRKQWIAADKQGRDWNISVWARPSELLVIDCDLDKDTPGSWSKSVGPFDDDGVSVDVRGETPGLSAWLAMCEEHEVDPFDTRTVITPSGGIHFYYAYPEQEIRKGKYPEVFGTTLLDVQTQDSYVVAAGSAINDIEYECTNPEVDPLPVYDWLVDILKPKPDDPEVFLAKMKSDSKNAVAMAENDRLINYFVEDILRQTEGTRTDEYVRKVWKAHRLGATNEQLDKLAAAAGAVGLSEAEQRKVLVRIPGYIS